MAKKRVNAIGVSQKPYKYASKSKGSEDDDIDTEEVWDSGLKVMDSPQVIVPEEVRQICVSLQRELKGTEFGILFKGEWTDAGFRVYPDYVIPEQNVSAAHIDYEEDLKKYRDQGYVVNAHSHPNSGERSGFSGVDDEHINSHFEVAILFAGRAETIVDAIANLHVEDGIKLQISPDVEIEKPEPDYPDVDTDNIEVKTVNTGSDDSDDDITSYQAYKKRKKQRAQQFRSGTGMAWSGNYRRSKGNRG